MSANRPQNKNLRPFPKGVSGNPAGRPKSSVGAAKVRDTLQRLFKMKRGELLELIQNDSAPSLDQFFASVIASGIAGGDYLRLSALLDRMVGRVKQDMPDDEQPPEGDGKSGTKVFTTEELIRLVRATKEEK